MPAASLTARINALARRQKALVQRHQLLGIGVSAAAIDRRVAKRELTVMHRGVYLVGPIVPEGATELAAVYATGPDSFAAGRSAAHLHGYVPAPEVAEVTTTRRGPHSRPGLTVHRTASLWSDETLILDGIPVTTPARTILDLAPSLTPDELEQLVAEACARSRPTRRQLDDLLARYPRRKGTRALRRLLHQPHGPAFTRSPPERLLLNLLREAELPPPETNARARTYEVDVLWRELKLVAEFDSQAFHAAWPQRERDSRRDQDLIRHGFVVFRITWSQLTQRRIALAARIAMTIGRRQLELGR